MSSLILLVILFFGLAAAARRVWRRAPDTTRHEVAKAARDLRLMTGSYSLKLLMQRMIDDMLDSVVPGLKRSYVPNDMRFGLHPDDAARWGDFFPVLRDELRTALLEEIARRPALLLTADVAITLAEDAAARPGRPSVKAALRPVEHHEPAGGPDHDGHTVLAPDRVETILDAASWTVQVRGQPRRPLTGELVIGRGPKADIRVVDTGVSREHVRLTVLGDRVSLVDLQSSNGTWVNGKRVEVALIGAGNRVALGRRAEVVLEPAR